MRDSEPAPVAMDDEMRRGAFSAQDLGQLQLWDTLETKAGNYSSGLPTIGAARTKATFAHVAVAVERGLLESPA